ncbi:Lysine exporter protein (LYSE/YGGA) [Shewanella halifaxensis HAW-EB4]|uniref:Lysine exporter protein (LYSE/YGGA) n=1 Tax=Shewanella halifaxensis (strain HAW-EB4) TaxID=458817 RepID=B0TUE4_SHEHH|nr:LysE family transporter [Shewanella halifaxensis]ABZ75444.1 Lysine exporter protein (LYSE/YGGA) [Shewanella halifaxensis HAW-EB4]
MALDTWLIYLVAIIGLSLAPGPNGLMALTHGVMYGHRKTLFTITGGVLGFVVLIALTMFGIGALLLASADLLLVFKWIGGIYLIWLGIRIWRSPAIELQPVTKAQSVSDLALFRQGALAAITNPKVLLFFGAFLPQFIEPEQPLLAQFIVMAATFAVIEFVVEYLIARVATKLRPWLARSGKRFNQCCGGLFTLIGASLPLYNN